MRDPVGLTMNWGRQGDRIGWTPTQWRGKRTLRLHPIFKSL